jgi:hypothetical protein
MVFVHDAPLPIHFAEAHGQSKLQLFPLSVRVDASALSYRRGKGYVLPCSDLYVVKVKGDRLLRHAKQPARKRFSH